MNRKHDTKYYLKIIEKIKKVNSNIKFSSDFIIGYPGETEKDYKNTIDIIKEVGFVNSYSYIFSPRPGTPAANKNMNKSEINKIRLKNLQKIIENQQLENNKKYIDKFSEVLVENKLTGQDKYFGRTKFMEAVIFQSDFCNNGEIINVKINSCNRNNLFGVHKINNSERAA
tara:strand:- start:212 stop:724 length:513 start_codon:yes stop_codon:yes gene_type:complete